MKNAFIKNTLISAGVVLATAGIATFAQTAIDTNIFNAVQTIMRTVYTDDGSAGGNVLMDINNSSGIFISGALLQNTTAVNGLGIDADGYITTNLNLGGGGGGSGDHDRYVAETNDSPTNINQDIYTFGSVGIDTNAPQASLHVSGDVRIDTLATHSSPSEVLVPGPNGEVMKAPFPISGTATGSLWQTGAGLYSVQLINDESNEAIAPFSTIAGGQDNTNSGAYSTIAGGQSNTISLSIAGFAFIGGGSENQALAQYANIVGGFNNTIAGFNSFIGGGANNHITASGANSFIGGGQQNTGDGAFGFIGGGEANSIVGDHSFIGGGQHNTITDNSSSIVGGNNNTVGGVHSAILGGNENQIDGDRNTILGGGSNTILGTLSLSFGLNSQINGNNIFLRDPLGMTDTDPVTQDNSFIIHASNGVGINTNTPQKALHVNGAIASSLIKISTGGTNINVQDFMQRVDNNLFDTGSNIDFNGVERDNHINSEGTALFIPAFVSTGGDMAFFSSTTGEKYSGHVTYIVIIDANQANHIQLQPGTGEQFIILGIKNGVMGQEINMRQKPIIVEENDDGDTIPLNTSIIVGRSAVGGLTFEQIANSITSSAGFPAQRAIIPGEDMTWSPMGISMLVGFNPILAKGERLVYDGEDRNMFTSPIEFFMSN